jgi:mRNA interferase MazF
VGALRPHAGFRDSVVVVPLSTSPTSSPPLLVPVQCSGRTVVAVTDQTRAVAKERGQERLGEISTSDVEAVEAGVRRVLELG